MNILITDSENDIGSFLSRKLKENHTVFDFSKDTLYLPDKSKTCQVITSINPDIVIHTSSIDDMDYCENNETFAYSFNTIGSLNTAYPCSLLNIPIVYFSTSYVYEGTKSSPYYETDECNPINIYGKTKLAGEKLIRTLCKKYFILRPSWLYGGENCFIKKLLTNKSASVFMCSKEIGNPTYIEDLCDAVEKIISTDLYGIYNCSAKEKYSKMEWITAILKGCGLNKKIIELPPDMELKGKAIRPVNTSLNTSLMINCFDIELPSLEQILPQYLSNINKL